MIELEKLDKDGKLLFSNSYPKLKADELLNKYGVYAGTDKVMWRKKAAKAKKAEK